MKLFYTLLITVIFTSACLGQQVYQFEIAYQENTTYKTVMGNVGDIVMDIDADEEMKSQLEAAGQKFPMKMTTQQAMDSEMITQGNSSEGFLPVRIVYGEMSIKNTMNGQEMPNNQGNPLEGVEVLATIDKGEIAVDKITGSQVTAELEAITKSTIEKLFDVVKFPEGGLKIGDEFSIDMPMSLPVMGKTMEIAIQTTYLLKDVNGQTALFDIVQKMKMDTSLEGAAMSATGTGTGEMTFDMSKSYFTKYNTNLNMDMKINVPTPGASMNMHMNMDMKSALTVDIESN